LDIYREVNNQDLMLAVVAALAPPMPRLWALSRKVLYGPERPKAMDDRTESAVALLQAHREGREFGSWAELKLDAPDLAGAAKGIVDSIQNWKASKAYHEEQEDVRLDKLWRAEWAEQMVLLLAKRNSR
jgi:hypothetical protein